MIDPAWAERLAALTAAAAPALFLMALLHTRSGMRHLREPLWVGFGLGFCLFASVILVEVAIGMGESRIIDPRLYGLVDAVFGAALPEELAKALVLMFIVLRHEDVRRPIDAVPLALGVALGFATIENMFMIVDEPDWGATAASRALIAVPGYAFYGLIMGFFAARFLTDRRRRHLVSLLAVPVLLHGLYDVPLLTIDRADVVGLPVELLPFWPYIGVFAGTLAGFVIIAVLTLRRLRRTPAFYAPRTLQGVARPQVAAVLNTDATT